MIRNRVASMREGNNIAARLLDNLEKEYNVSVYFLRRYLALLQARPDYTWSSLSPWLLPRLPVSNTATAMCINEALFEVLPLCRTPRRNALLFRVASARVRTTVHIYRDILVPYRMVVSAGLARATNTTPYKQHTNTQFITNNFINILYFIHRF